MEHHDDPWPAFGRVSVVVEGFVYYSQYSTKVILHDLAKWFPSANIHSHTQHTVMMLAAVASFVMGYLADDLVGKYRMVLYVYVFSILGPLAALTSLYYPHLSVTARTMSFLASLYLWFPVLAVEATRVALISEQFKIPEALRNLKMFYFLLMVNRYGGSGFAGVIMKVEQYFGGNKIQLTIRVTILLVVAICYSAALILFDSKIRKKRLQMGVVDGVIACIFSALYNRAFRRRKMPANAKWIDYSDAKYYKETKDSALQLVQMSFIYMPFSIFFGLNEFLDVIWMEQNEWIGSKGSTPSFISSMSIITVYHTVDVILLPIFEYLIEFVLPRCNIVLSDLQLIGSAVFLLGLAYLATTILQSVIENGSYPPDPGDAVLRFFNSMRMKVTIATPYTPTMDLEPGELFEIRNVKPREMIRSGSSFDFPAKVTANDSSINQNSVVLKAREKVISSYVVNENSIITLNAVDEPGINFAVVDVVNGVITIREGELHMIKEKEHKSKNHGHHEGGNVDKMEIPVPEMNKLVRKKISKGHWTVKLVIKDYAISKEKIEVLPRQRLTVFISEKETGKIRMTLTKSSGSQSVPLWFTFPQILLRSFADGIGKISTYFFTYTQSPRKLRATAFGVLYFAQFALPSVIGMVSGAFMNGLSSFTLSIYTLIVFLALVFFIRFSLKYEEI